MVLAAFFKSGQQAFLAASGKKNDAASEDYAKWQAVLSFSRRNICRVTIPGLGGLNPR